MTFMTFQTKFTQQDGRKKRTAKHLCVTNVTGQSLVCDKHDRAITCVFCRNLQFTLMFSGPLPKDLFKGK